MTEQILTLPQAAARMNISVLELQRLIESGKIEAVRLPNGELALGESQVTQITREKFKALDGRPITVAQAVEKYSLNKQTLWGWINRGYIDKLREGWRTEVNEADVAYCAAVYHERDIRPGQRVFDENGKPYELKLPDLADYRQKRQQ